MKKLACFVEGLTEQYFLGKLIEEIAGKQRIVIEKKKCTGEIGCRSVRVIQAAERNGCEAFYILIYDSSGDSTVKSDILDYRQRLINEGYSLIIGLRDVYPMRRTEIPSLERGLRYGVPTNNIRICFFLAVMEIEAWFSGETTHFSRIHKNLTEAKVVTTLNFDPRSQNPEIRPNPAKDLDKIYSTVQLRYKKEKKKIERTVNALDYGKVYLELTDRISRLKTLTTEIDAFLS